MAEAGLSPALAPSALALLLAWFSPACPIGAYSYSHGLEALHEAGALADATAVHEAVETLLLSGAGRSDGVLLAQAYRATAAGDETRLAELAALSLALCPSAERHAETLHQAEAFAELIDAVFPAPRSCAACLPAALPVVIGRAGAFHGVPLASLAQAYLTAFAANLVSAAVRLVPLGQTDGQRLTAALSATAIGVAAQALAADPEDFGSAALGADLASMRHEEQTVRLFRS